jgi:tetratricopeptide (TPR) repeat protein
MKLKNIGILILFASNLIMADPLLVVAIMVKNEELVIAKTLEPYAKADPQKNIAYFVFDTRSTDLTIQKAQEFFASYGITNFHICQEEFVDFSTSRNRALDLVEHYYPNATFVIMPDAEWYINDVPGLLKYCQQEKYNEQFGPYFIRIIEATLDFFVPRLIRQKLHSRFKGVVHEALTVYSEQIPFTRAPSTIYFEYKPTHVSQEKTRKRHVRDRDLLLTAYEKDPSDTQVTYYLAQTYESLGDWENAYKFYTIRTNQNGWEEDNFLAAYKRAFSADNLMKHTKAMSWEQVNALYLKAYSLRPTRIEPLIRISSYYFEEQNFPLAYLYARYSIDIPYPLKDTNFVEKDMYHYSRYALVGITGWYMQDYERGEVALRKAIEIAPDDVLLYQFLTLYVDHRLKNN